MKISALASGSSGNCFYIENHHEKGILVDAGISAKQICERLNAIGRKPDNVAGIFVTHEHCDHVRGADVFARNFKIPIFATKKTAKESFLCSDFEFINNIKNDETLKIGGMKVCAFPKKHLAADPISYSIYEGKKKVSVITDLGTTSQAVEEAISFSNAVFLESNYDEEMLEQGPYPFPVKKWIKSDLGHLSNVQAGCCVLEHASPKLKNIILSHLSKTNNKPELALETFNGLIKERKNLAAKVIVSNREIPTPLLKV